jgi:hypothetical protein
MLALASLEHMRYDTGVFVSLARQEGGNQHGGR